MQLYEGAVFDKALSSGGAILTVRVHDDGEAAKAERILAEHRPVDIEARGTGLIAEHRALGAIKDEVLRLRRSGSRSASGASRPARPASAATWSGMRPGGVDLGFHFIG